MTALADYGQLLAAVAAWTRRRDLGERAREFVALFEDRVAAELRVREMEGRAAATVTDRYVPLPADFLAMRNIQLGAGPEGTLTYVTPDYLDAEGHRLTGRPRHWTLVGNRVQFAPAPSEAEPAEIEISYYAFPRLSDDNATNWLLLKWPSAYLYGALCEAQGYALDDARMQLWEARLSKTLAAIRSADLKARHGAGPLAPRGRLTQTRP